MRTELKTTEEEAIHIHDIADTLGLAVIVDKRFDKIFDDEKRSGSGQFQFYSICWELHHAPKQIYEAELSKCYFNSLRISIMASACCGKRGLKKQDAMKAILARIAKWQNENKDLFRNHKYKRTGKVSSLPKKKSKDKHAKKKKSKPIKNKTKSKPFSLNLDK